jgi:tetratricopeptide (TPR) repeat protein
VHRDLKPHNCLITPERTLKVTDGGVATIFDGLNVVQDSTEALPGHRLRLAPGRAGTFAGTGTHLAPELFDDPTGADGRADIYAFGVMLFQMLTGKLPFEAQTWTELAHLHQTQAPPSLTPPFTALNPLIERCLAKDPAQRLADFRTLREPLAALYTRLTQTQAPQPLVGSELEAAQQDSIGSSLGSLGRYEEALGWHDRALELQPRYEPAVVHQSMVLEGLGRHEEALAFCDRALEINAQSEAALVQQGLVLGLLGRMNEARGSCDQALSLNPRNEQAWVNMGVALEALERPMEALASYNNAVTLNPRMEQAWFNAAVLLGDLEQHAEALLCCDRTLEINPRNERAWVNKGLTLRELRRAEEALECLERALALNPRLEQAWFNKGVLLVNEFQRHAEALACFETAQELGHAQAAEGIALCREALG